MNGGWYQTNNTTVAVNLGHRSRPDPLHFRVSTTHATSKNPKSFCFLKNCLLCVAATNVSAPRLSLSLASSAWLARFWLLPMDNPVRLWRQKHATTPVFPSVFLSLCTFVQSQKKAHVATGTVTAPKKEGPPYIPFDSISRFHTL
jgi:hypothetical protein